MEKELKSCPFCGGEAYVQHFPLSDTYSVMCAECGINTRTETELRKAVEKWNRRTHWGHTKEPVDGAGAGKHW